MQYNTKPNAQQTVFMTSSLAVLPQVSTQDITFSAVPTSGTFVLSYNGVSTPSINWNDSASTIQTDLQTIPALASVTVTGSIASQTLTVTFTGVIPTPAQLLVVVSSTLAPSVTINITETDVTLPLAIQQAFNILPGYPIATGVQLDVIGQWVGVSRSGQGLTEFITLDDADYLQLIYIAIANNSLGSSLSDIQNYLQLYFSGEVYVFDTTLMGLIYIISQAVGSQEFIQLVIADNLLPKPMGVGLTIYYPPNTNLFVFTGATQPIPPFGGGMTTAQAPDLTGHWLQAQDLYIV